MSSFIRRSLFVGALLLAILACNLPLATPVIDPNAAWTAAALTVAAAMNQNATPSPFVLASPFPSLPPVDTFTPLPTLSPTSIFTSTPSIPLISVSVNTNCRVGPGKVYDRVGGLLVGETAEVFGKDPSSNYWYIRNPDNSNSFCWLWGEYATLSGNTAFLPIYTPPPTPTPQPDFDVEYANIDSCVGWWLEFILENTGPVTFESIGIAIRDADTGTALNDSSNGFTDLGGCLSSSIINKLDPGDMYTVSGPVFIYNPSGHRIKATITLCTAEGLGGTCISKTLNFRP